MSRLLTSYEIYAAYGSVIALDLYADLAPLYQEDVDEVRYNEKVGNKTVYRLKKTPVEWNIKAVTRKPARVELKCGSFFLPHKDHLEDQEKFIRLNCHPNFTHPEECTYVINGQIQHWRVGQWMIINPNLTHYSFCFKNDVVHYIVDIDISDKASQEWLLSKIQYRSDRQK